MRLGTYPGLTGAQVRKKVAQFTGQSVSNTTLSELLNGWYGDVVATTFRRPREVIADYDRLDARLKATIPRAAARSRCSRQLQPFSPELLTPAASGCAAPRGLTKSEEKASIIIDRSGRFCVSVLRPAPRCSQG
jgi:hypothetical protein